MGNSALNLYLFVIITILIALSINFVHINNKKHPFAGLNIDQLLEKFEYPLETHQVITDDGYILTLHRIPHGRSKNGPKKRIPILFMPGTFQTSVEYINLGPGHSLALLLADQGYDIFLGNVRGTTLSRSHVKLNPDTDDAYWNFSMHEIGLYDVKSSIDHILNVTKQEKLHCVGFSQGTQVLFVLASERPEYADKIRLITALAPAIYLKNSESPLVQVTIYTKFLLKPLGELFNAQELFTRDGLLSLYLSQICDENSIFVNLCLHNMFILHGFNYEYVNKSLLSVITSNVPSGMGVKQLWHLMQLFETGEFKQFDYGRDENFIKYVQESPPFYNLSNVKTAVALYYSSNDWTVNYKNIEEIEESLPNVVQSYLIPSEHFNHNDFIYGVDIVKLLYNSVIDQINKH